VRFCSWQGKGPSLGCYGWGVPLQLSLECFAQRQQERFDVTLSQHRITTQWNYSELPDPVYMYEMTVSLPISKSDSWWNRCVILPTLSTYPTFLHACCRPLPQTHTTSAATWEQTNQLVCSSCRCKLVHVQTSLGTGVCLTWHATAFLGNILSWSGGSVTYIYIYKTIKSLLFVVHDRLLAVDLQSHTSMSWFLFLNL
jgi:hypothetical protein